ncbi:MAG: TolC family protein [Maribacter sp.]|nr:TolC family protein [Maribacter sp.]
MRDLEYTVVKRPALACWGMPKQIAQVLLISLFLIGMVSKVHAQSLEEYIGIATQNNPEVKTAYVKFEAAMQKAPQVMALPDPTITMSAFGRMIETRIGRQEARFSLMQMFPWFGTLSAKENVANLLAEAAFQNYLDTRNEVILKLKETYAELYELRQMIQLEKENLSILETYRKLGLSNFSTGKGTMVDVVRIDIDLNKSRTTLEILEGKERPLQISFNTQLNRGLDEMIAVPNNLTLGKVIDRVGIDSLFEVNPKLVGLEKQMASYEAQQLLSKKEGYPMIGLGVDYSIIGQRDIPNLDMNGQDAIMPMLTLTLPIYRKKYRASQKEAELMVQAVTSEKQAVKNSLYSEYTNAVFDLSKAGQLKNLYRKQTESTEQAIQLLLVGFSNNTSDFEEILRMNQDLLLYKTAMVAETKNEFAAQSKIDYLLSKAE